MNSLDDLLDRLNELGSNIWSRLEENSTFNTLREKFETLSSSAQRLITIGAISLVVLLIVSIPLTSLLGSSTYVSEFEEKKDLIERMLAAEQSMKQGSPLPKGLSSADLQGRVRNRLQMFRLVEGQGPTLAPLNNKPAGKLAPDIVEQAGVQVTLKGLNLKQTINVGKAMESLHASVKLLGLDIQASTQFPKYYDVVFRLVSFSLPQAEAPKGKDNKAKGKGNRARGRSKFKRKGK